MMIKAIPAFVAALLLTAGCLLNALGLYWMTKEMPTRASNVRIAMSAADWRLWIAILRVELGSCDCGCAMACKRAHMGSHPRS